MINSIRLPFIAEMISKKGGFVVMFPDSTGNVYRMNSVPIEVQRSSSRAEYMKKHNLKPVAVFEVAFDGILEIYSDQADPSLMKKAQDLLEKKFGISYLLVHNYITKVQALAMVSGAVLAHGGGDLSVSDSVTMAESAWQVARTKNVAEIHSWLDSNEQKAIAASKDMSDPEDLSPAAIQTIDVQSENVVTVDAVTTEPRVARSRAAK
jgi:hypothetical protein